MIFCGFFSHSTGTGTGIETGITGEMMTAGGIESAGAAGLGDQLKDQMVWALVRRQCIFTVSWYSMFFQWYCIVVLQHGSACRMDMPVSYKTQGISACPIICASFDVQEG